jgi:tRNA(Ile)-lysidine synthase
MLQQYHKKHHWILAVSGGSDSMALMYMVYRWLVIRANNPKVVVAHVNHNTGPTAELAERIVKYHAERLAFGFHSIKWETVPKSNLHSKARKLRYDFFAKLSRLHDDSCVFTAHNLQDNAETVLMRIERGSGVDGLCGIHAHKNIDGSLLVRPMLQMTKSQVHCYLSSLCIPWIEDPANQSLKFRRSFYRHKILVLFDPIYQRRLNLLSENMRNAQKALAHYTELEYQKYLLPEGLSLAFLQEVPLDIQRRILLKFIMGRPRLHSLDRALADMRLGISTRLCGHHLRVTKGLLIRS